MFTKEVYAQTNTTTNTTNTNTTNSASDVWIDCDQEKMTNWQCSMEIYKTIGFDEKETSPKSFVKDLFTGTTMFIWTLVSISLVIAWVYFVFSWWQESWADKWKKWIYNAIIWLLLVLFSMVIVYWFIYVISWK